MRNTTTTLLLCLIALVSNAKILKFDQTDDTNTWNENGDAWTWSAGEGRISTLDPFNGLGHALINTSGDQLITSEAFNLFHVYLKTVNADDFASLSIVAYDNQGAIIEEMELDPMSYTDYQKIELDWTDVHGFGIVMESLDESLSPNVYLDDARYDFGFDGTTIGADDDEGSVNVGDAVPPNALCRDYSVQLDENGNASILSSDINNGSSDNMGFVSFNVFPSSFDHTNAGENSVTLAVTDNNGNTATCNAIVTVELNEMPLAVCEDIILPLNEDGTVSITAEHIGSQSVDDAEIVALTIDNFDFDCTNIGVNIINLDVQDNDGNTDQCAAVVTVIDETYPVIECETQITKYLNENGVATVSIEEAVLSADDACGIANISLNHSEFTCENAGINEVLATVVDMGGNASSCVIEVKIDDLTAPEILCDNITLNIDGTGEVMITPEHVGIVLENCDPVSIEISQSTFTEEHLGENTVNYTVVDQFDNTSTCESTVTVLGEGSNNGAGFNFTVFPNPIGRDGQTVAYVRGLEPGIDHVELTIYNLNNTPIAQYVNHEVYISTSFVILNDIQLTPGVYNVELVAGDHLGIQQLIVE